MAKNKGKSKNKASTKSAKKNEEIVEIAGKQKEEFDVSSETRDGNRDQMEFIEKQAEDNAGSSSVKLKQSENVANREYYDENAPSESGSGSQDWDSISDKSNRGYNPHRKGSAKTWSRSWGQSTQGGNQDLDTQIRENEDQGDEDPSSTKPEPKQKRRNHSKESRERQTRKETSDTGSRGSTRWDSDNKDRFSHGKDFKSWRQDPQNRGNYDNKTRQRYNFNRTEDTSKSELDTEVTEKESSDVSFEMQCESIEDKTEFTKTQDEDSSVKKFHQRTHSKERYETSEKRSKERYFNNNDQSHREVDRKWSRRSEPIRVKVSAQNREDAGNRNKQRPSLNFYENRDTRRPQDRSNDPNESEYRKYEDEFRRTNGVVKFERVNEIEQDLFAMPDEYSLAHCVAEDMGMGSGIAVHFRYKFKRIDELLNQRQSAGGLAVLKDDDRYIYYLVTKRHSTGKPTYRTLFASLQKMKTHMEQHEVKKLAMPRIGCGLDRLEWDNVKFMTEYIFRDSDVDIVICNLQQVESSPQSRHRNCKQVNVIYPIQDIEPGTIIVYLSSEEGYISEEMKSLDEKFHFLTDFRYHKKSLGDVVVFTKNEKFLLAGCIVKKHDRDPVDFAALKDCVADIQRTNKKYEFFFVGFQAIKDERDSCINYKIINILRNNLRNVDVYICWPGELSQEMSMRDRFSDSFTEESSAKKPFRQNSFTRKDKDDSWGSWSEPKKDPPLRKNLFESGCRRPHPGEESNSDNLNDADDEANTSQKSGERDWFEEGEQQKAKQFKKDEVRSGGESSSKRKDELSDQTVPTTFSQSENTNIDNSEYQKYKQEPKKSGNFTKVKILHSLNNLPEKFSKVCYVSEDMCLQSAADGTDIATHLGYLLNRNQKEGSCVFVKDGQEYLYYLIVRKLSNSRYQHDVIFASIQQLKDQVVKHRIQKLVIPLMKESTDDGFDWAEVPQMFEFLFRDVRVDLILAPFPQGRYTESVRKRNKIVLNHARHPLFQMKKKSMIIFWASEDGAFSEDMMKLKEKFDFENAFRKDKKQIAKVMRYKENEDYVLYGCVVRKTQRDTFNFSALQQCISFVNESNTEGLRFAAASAVDHEDETVNYKVMNILVNNLQNVNISFCWPGPLREKMPSKNT